MKYATTLCTLLTAVTCFIQGTACADGEPSNRPNIVWITCEDLSPRLGCYGDKTAPTPNIDRLAKEGVRYTRAFATGGVCAPARHALITGMYPTATMAMHMRTGSRSSATKDIKDPVLREKAMSRPLYEAVPPDGVRCFTERLRSAGYYCTNNSKQDYQFKAPPTAWDESSRKAHWRKRPDPNQPFFAVFNFTVTHESGVFGNGRSPKTVDPANVPVPPYYPDTPTVRGDLAKHYDNIAALDKQVGRVMRELREDRLLDSTIVFFFSDHGDGLPRCKRWVYDSGTRVPLVVRWPGGRDAGTTNDRIVSFVDFGPTVLSLAGVEVPAGVHGSPFLGAQAGEPRRYAFMHRDRMDELNLETVRSVRDWRYRYVRNYQPDRPYVKPLAYRDRSVMMQELNRMIEAGELGPDQWQLTAQTKPREELYDCVNDPHNIRNIADDPKHAAKVKELSAALDGWLKLTNDPLDTPETELLKTRVWPPDGKQPTTATPKARVAEVIVSMYRRYVVVECDTPGASIGYRFGSKGPWRVYTGPFELKHGIKGKVQVVAHRIGYKRSAIVTLDVARK